MSEVVIRAFKPSDWSAVLRAMIERQDYEASLHDTRLPGDVVGPAYLNSLLRDLPTRNGALFVAETDGLIIGVVACLLVEGDEIEETAESNRHGYVTDIFVDTRYRGRGVAQQLLARAEEHLAATGATRLRINVLAVNAKARRAYQHYGFDPYEVMYEKRMHRKPSG
jgi:ribosomal protein S18 acetylase RimI-like enzyme